jgi:hypothetical protein
MITQNASTKGSNEVGTVGIRLTEVRIQWVVQPSICHPLKECTIRCDIIAWRLSCSMAGYRNTHWFSVIRPRLECSILVIVLASIIERARTLNP